MTIIHPTGEILHILADAGVPHDWLHETARRISAAYSEANEGRTGTKEAPYCMDCGMPYAAAAFQDLVLPDWAWRRINPAGDGLLCPNCIVARCVTAGLANVPAYWASGPLIGVPGARAPSPPCRLRSRSSGSEGRAPARRECRDHTQLREER